MGDPTYFSVVGGANPHTRDRWGRKREVDRERAIEQWKRLRDTLRDLGVRVVVVPPAAEQPGLVYPANAGFQLAVDAEKPLNEKTFYLSNLLPTRAGERKHYETVLREAGIRFERIDENYRFEGEADFFPCGPLYILTGGHIERQRFVPRFGIPPWKRVYGFRTQLRVIVELSALVPDHKIIRAELIREAHYHGDTALCAFGHRRQNLLVYREAISSDGWLVLRDNIDEDLLIPIGQEDAERYAANSFTLNQGDESFLVMPEGVSQRLRAQVKECGVTPVTVDVSEFLKKGGGSVKCMIGDLGPVPDDHELGSFEFSGR